MKRDRRGNAALYGVVEARERSLVDPWPNQFGNEIAAREYAINLPAPAAA